MERNIMMAGFGGQGVLTMGKLLSQATTDSTDLNVTFFPAYGAAMRGGTSNCYVVISDMEIAEPISDQVDDLIVMNDLSLHKYLSTLRKGGTLYVNSSIIKEPIGRDDVTVIEVPVTEMALEMGNPRALNFIMLGVYIGFSEAVPAKVITAGIHHKFEGKPKVVESSDNAFQSGLAIGRSKKEGNA
jgi:2-oxoglutarate ferredoxin oxidoreductase subunit gamma